MKFLQCSDLHIGAAVSEGRDEDFYCAFSSIVQQAIQNEVDFMLICGDLFDRRDVSALALRQASSALELLKQRNIPAYAIEGNHDKALYRNRESWMGYLNSMGLIRLLHTPADAAFQEGENIVYHKGIRIIGLEYQGARSQDRLCALLEDLPEYDGQSILMVHAPIDQMAGFDYAFVNSSELKPFRGKIDYIAAGHIHRRYEIGGWIYNAGAPECVKIEEGLTGEKGFYLAEIEPEGITPTFIPAQHRRVLQCQIDLAGAAGVEQAKERITSRLCRDYGGACLQLVMVGECGFDPVELDLSDLGKNIREERNCAFVKFVVLAQQKDRKLDLTQQSQEDIQQKVIEQLLAEQGIYGVHCARHVVALKQLLLESEEETQQMRAVLENFLEEGTEHAH